MRFCSACGSRFSNDARYCPIDGQPTQEQPDPVPGQDPLLGQVIGGRYRIERMLGEGGMGVVYLATHTALQKRMAVKVLRGEMARDPDVVQRFIQEAQASSSIGHPNIIDISDFDRLSDGSVYFVMEMLEGETLTDRIARCGRMPLSLAVPILEMIASALSAAHARGIIHRDMKPDNVFLVRRGGIDHFVKVLDFGIAKVGGAASKLTKTGMVFGTPHYMSPEQAAGQPVDARADVYAVGIIMYEMVTGRVPFDGDTFMGILSKHMFEPPRPPTELAGADLGPLEPVILRALAKRPEARYPSMQALVDDLGRIRAGQPVAGPDVPSLAAPLLARGARNAPAPAHSTSSADDVPATTGHGARPWILVASAAVLLLLGAVAGGVYALVSKQARTSEVTSTVEVAASAPPAASAPAVPSPAAPSPAAPSSAPAPTSAPLAAPSAPPVETPVGAPTPLVLVRIISDPPGATATLDDAVLGTTPLEIPRPAGETRHRITLERPGYANAIVSVTAGSPGEIRAELARAGGAAPTATRRAEGHASVAPPTTSGSTSTPAPTPRPAADRAAQPDVIDPWQ